MPEHKDNKKKMDKPTKVVHNNLTPVTIMVEDTISSVKSRVLLKVLMDSGSRMIMINKNAYLEIASHVKLPAVDKSIL